MILRFFDSLGATPAKLGPKVLGLAFIAFGTSLYAEEQATTEAVKEAAEEKGPFSGAASLSLRSSTTSASDYDYRIFLAAGVNLEYEFKDLLTVGLSGKGSKDLNNEQRYTMTDTTVSVSRSFEPSDGLNLGIDGYYGFPVSKDLIKYSNSKGTLGGSGSLSYSFAGQLNGLSLSAGLVYGRYLYQYESANGGELLTKYSWSQVYGVSYAYEAYTLSVNFTNVSTWDFAGDKGNDSYLWVETLQYAIDDVWTMSAGHINDGTTYDYLGAQNNVQFYDKRRSQVFVGGSYKF